MLQPDKIIGTIEKVNRKGMPEEMGIDIHIQGAITNDINNISDAPVDILCFRLDPKKQTSFLPS